MRMGLGRQKATLEDADAWVFNKLEQAYAARPAYPCALVDRIDAEATRAAACRLAPDGAQGTALTPGDILDIGAGTGSLTLPLAGRGHHVTAIEPAKRMLAALRRKVTAANAANITTHHAASESLPLQDQSVDVALISDALHFLDVMRTSREITRVLRPSGTLMVVVCGFGQTPFMRALMAVVEKHADRRMRSTDRALVQLFQLCGRPLVREPELEDHSALSPQALKAVLASFSFIGAAFTSKREAAFHVDLDAITHSPVWTRRIGIFCGRAK